MGETPAMKCVDCAHFERCAFLIASLTGAETECDFVPSRFVRASRWRRSANKALAVGRGERHMGRHLGAPGRMPS